MEKRALPYSILWGANHHPLREDLLNPANSTRCPGSVISMVLKPSFSTGGITDVGSREPPPRGGVWI